VGGNGAKSRVKENPKREAPIFPTHLGRGHRRERKVLVTGGGEGNHRTATAVQRGIGRKRLSLGEKKRGRKRQKGGRKLHHFSTGERRSRGKTAVRAPESYGGGEGKREEYLSQKEREKKKKILSTAIRKKKSVSRGDLPLQGRRQGRGRLESTAR